MTRGFSLLELVVVLALVMVVMSGVFVALSPAADMFSAGPEAADQQQRLRVAADALARDVRAAGRGASIGARAGPLTDAFAAVLPFRQGRRLADPPGRFRTDTITLLTLLSDAVVTTTRQALPAQDGSVQINRDAGCPDADASCGFRASMSVVVFDGSGAFDTFTVTQVQADVLTLQHNMADSSVVYPAGATIAEAASRTYYLKTDAVTGLSQLMQYDGGGGADVPVADHVVALRFDYAGDPRPPSMRVPLSDPFGPWTTYGPKPPAATVSTTAYPLGENCAFQLHPTLGPVPRLAPLGGGGRALVPLGLAELTDGPWCPDATSPTRYDADLLRVRTVAVTVRVEAAAASLRGPAGPLFTRAGTSSDGDRWLRDEEIRFVMAPRNLNAGR